MIQYRFNSAKQILEVVFTDEITMNDLIEYGEMIKNNTSLPRELRILTDASQATYKFQVSELAQMMNALKVQIEPYTWVKTAVIQEKPKETAISMMVDTVKPIAGYSHKVFYTYEAALEWLLQ